MILTAVMAHQRKLIRHAVVAILVAANTSAGARVKATRVEPHKKSQLPALSVYTLSEDDEESTQAPREITRTLKLEITGWVSHTDTNPADDQMDDLAAQIEAAMDADRYLSTALGITAVDQVTGQITIPAHGLATGDGHLVIVAQTGGVVPAGLWPLVELFAIVVDANTIKLAMTNALALAGTAMTFTGNGTLPLQVRVPTVAESVIAGTEMQIVEDDGQSDPLVGIVTLAYTVTYRTSPAAPASLDDLTTIDVTQLIAGGVADTVPVEDTFAE